MSRAAANDSPASASAAGGGDPLIRSRDLTPDGTGIVRVIETVGGVTLQPPIHVVLNWFTELESRVPSPQP